MGVSQETLHLYQWTNLYECDIEVDDIAAEEEGNLTVEDGVAVPVYQCMYLYQYTGDLHQGTSLYIGLYMYQCTHLYGCNVQIDIMDLTEEDGVPEPVY